jgi:multidrug efflux pump subunit AcrA (membrane-fusion protein)
MKFLSLSALAILLALCVMVTSCGSRSSSETQAASESSATPAIPQVDVTVVKSHKLNATIGLPAELVPYESVDMYARETGFVKSIKVDRGSRVKQGELIAELEAPELLAQQAQANAAYQSTESQLAAGQAKLAADQATFQHVPRPRHRPLWRPTIWILLKRRPKQTRLLWQRWRKLPSQLRRAFGRLRSLSPI